MKNALRTTFRIFLAGPYYTFFEDRECCDPGLETSASPTPCSDWTFSTARSRTATTQSSFEWDGRGRSRTGQYAAIQRLRIMVDAGRTEVEWLDRAKWIGLRALAPVRVRFRVIRTHLLTRYRLKR